MTIEDLERLLLQKAQEGVLEVRDGCGDWYWSRRSSFAALFRVGEEMFLLSLSKYPPDTPAKTFIDHYSGMCQFLPAGLGMTDDEFRRMIEAEE